MCDAQLLKVQKHNESVEVKRCLKEDDKEFAETKQRLEEAHSQKCQKAEAHLSERKEKAGQHNEKVAERLRDVQQKQEEAKKLLEESFAQKIQKVEVQWIERKEKACHHNEKVAERVRDAQQLIKE